MTADELDRLRHLVFVDAVTRAGLAMDDMATVSQGLKVDHAISLADTAP